MEHKIIFERLPQRPVDVHGPIDWNTVDAILKSSSSAHNISLGWTGLDGRYRLVRTSSPVRQEELDDARTAVRQKAEQNGWTPKRWWKFWRWNDFGDA